MEMDPMLSQEINLEDQYVMNTYKRKQVEFVYGEGMRLFDSSGNEYLDFLAGIAVDCLGHSHPAVIGAIQAQAGRLMHVSNYFYIEGRGKLARKISDLLSTGSGSVEKWRTFFANSGAEANEGGIKLARRYADMKGRPDAKTIVFLQKSFHGRTLATLAATGQPGKQDIFKPLPEGFVGVPQNDIEAFRAVLDGPEGGKVCAIILECIQGESGVWPCSKEFLTAVREETAKRDILLIADEVQTGFFRCGANPFAFQNYGVQADIVTMAKGIAGGFPMGAFAARDSVARAFQPGDHGTTFGGSNLAIATANAVIDALLAEKLGENSERVGAYLAEKLGTLSHVTEVRGAGLMRGLQLDAPIAAAAADAALENGLVINAPCPDVLRFLPPLICKEADVDVLAERLGDILNRL